MSDVSPLRFDLHHHFAPSQWIAAAENDPDQKSNNPWTNWTPDQSIEAMDRAGVTTAIASLTTPGVWLADRNFERREAALSLARECNEYGARLASNYPGRFGILAAIPLPEIEGSLRELDYAFDTLKLDGVGLMTSYGDRWLGDVIFTPIFEELNRRSAIVHVHPTTPNCCAGLLPGVGPSTIEYGTDTTRAILSLLINGVAEKFNQIRFIFSHAGGTLPFLISRIVSRNITIGADGLIGLPEGGGTRGSGPARLSQLRKFYYDTAQQANPVAMRALRQVVPVSQIVFGTDYPYTSILDHVKGLRESKVFDEDELRAIDYENSQSIFRSFTAR